MHDKKRPATNGSSRSSSSNNNNNNNSTNKANKEAPNNTNGTADGEEKEEQKQQPKNATPAACATSKTAPKATKALATTTLATKNEAKDMPATPPIIQLTLAPPTLDGQVKPTIDVANGKLTKPKDAVAEAASTAKTANAVHSASQEATAVAKTHIGQVSNPITTTTTTTTTSTFVPCGAPMNYCARRTWITTDRMNELRRKAQEAAKQNKIFTIRGCFNSVRNALVTRGFVEKLDMHRKAIPIGQMTFEDLTQRLPKRKAGETRRQYILKCERNIMSRFLEHMPVDFLWTNRKEKCDFIDQAKNPGMTINKFHRAPFTSKEGLCSQLRDFHWFFEEGTAEMYFPRCYNVWSPEELSEFIDNFKLTACVAFLRMLVDKYQQDGSEAVFSIAGKIPASAIDFAYKRCMDFIDSCQHNDIDYEDPPKIWEHDWDAFLFQHQQFVNEDLRIQHDGQRGLDCMLKSVCTVVDKMKLHWPQYSLDGYQNLWIVKPANKCRGRGILLMDNLKKIMGVVNPSIASKSRYVVQKYIERPLILFQTKFDIRQWFLITNTQPLVVWMYRESYLRFSSQEYSLTNHHESVHLTNFAIQKKYTNGKRDKRLPSENMWDCYSFQAYLRQIGKQSMWLERIYPGMRKAIVGTMLASQENMDRRPNTFELFGADFMICENFYPWLIEINSSPDLGATTSVTARMCPQCLEDVIKVVIDRRLDPKSEYGNFELVYRQVVPPTPAYMGLNLFVKGKQLLTKVNHGHNYYYHRKERTLQTSTVFRQRSALIPTATISRMHRAMPTFNATEYMEKYMVEPLNSSRSSISATGSTLGGTNQPTLSPLNSLSSVRQRPAASVAFAAPTSPCPYLLKQPHVVDGRRRSITQLISSHTKRNTSGNQAEAQHCQQMIGNSNTVPPKRQRSCGPRLNSITRDGTEKKFKIMIKTLTRGEHVAGPSTTKSENNLYELYESTKRNKQKTTESTAGAQLGYVAPATAPTVSERKWRSLRNLNTKTKAATVMAATTTTTTTTMANTTFTTTTTTTTTSIIPGVIPRRFNRTKSEIDGTANLHAIGRTFGRRSCHGRLPVGNGPPSNSNSATHSLNKQTPPPPPPPPPASVGDQPASAAASELNICVAQVISPRTKLSLTRSTTTTTTTTAPLNGTPLNVII